MKGALVWAALCLVACKADAPSEPPATAPSAAPAVASSASSAPTASAAPSAAVVADTSAEPAASAAPSSSSSAPHAPMVSCKTDDDCVPKTCCHATECTLRDKAPSCDKARCGKKKDKTLDYGGKCICTDGTCRAFTAKLPRGIKDMGRDPF